MNLIDLIKAGMMDEADLLEYVTDNDVRIAIAVAEAPNVTPPILNIAAHDRNREVRLAAVKNPNIDKITLQYLKNDKEIEIAELANRKLEENE